MRSTWILMNKPLPTAEVTLEDPETTLRIVMEDEVGLGGVTGWWGSVPGHIGTVEIAEGQTLQFQSDGTQETWCKIYHQICPRVVSRKQGAFPWVLIYQRRESSETIGVGRVRCCVHRPGFRWSVCSQRSVCLFHSVLCRGFWICWVSWKRWGPTHLQTTWGWGGTEFEPKHSTKPQMRGPTMHFPVFFFCHFFIDSYCNIFQWSTCNKSYQRLGGILQNITCLYDAMNLMTKVIVFPKDREGSELVFPNKWQGCGISLLFPSKS